VSTLFLTCTFIAWLLYHFSMDQSTILWYERLRDIANVHRVKATELAIEYLASEDEADRREALARFEIVKALEELMTTMIGA
jgi:hypothetical protein